MEDRKVNSFIRNLLRASVCGLSEKGVWTPDVVVTALMCYQTQLLEIVLTFFSVHKELGSI